MADLLIRAGHIDGLRRIPDFAVKHGENPMFRTGMVSAVLYLPLIWQPRQTGTIRTIDRQS